ncbi:MAG TPA: 2-phospho-L-lactate transferase [Acidimicrobiales bacterium]|nr:2-phospho-L-lactate transferase [Acidimicrobiales bacterium]
MIVALAGGVGAARMLRGLVSVVESEKITAIVNTGDDTVMHGLHVSPDLDTVTYTLAGMINPETGWGLVGESWSAMEQLRAYSGGRLGWFNLGDKDLGTHLYRTSRLLEGATLSQVALEIAARWGIKVRILPMSDQRVETRVVVAEGEIGFQEYFVGRRHEVPVSGVRLAGVEEASAAPGVLEAIAEADVLVICPSNPIVSIGPVLATGGIGEAVAAEREKCVAVSPIVAGRALKGPADRMLEELGHEASVVGVARMWAPYASTLVVDEADSDLAGAVEDAGMRAVVTPTVMTGPSEATALARVVLGGALASDGR